MAGRAAWGSYVAVGTGVGAAVLAVTLLAVLYPRDTGSVLAGDGVGGAKQLEEALARVAQLQAQNQLLRAQLTQQQEQLSDLQNLKDTIQLENEHLQKQLQGTRSQDSGGSWSWILIPLVVLVWKWLH